MRPVDHVAGLAHCFALSVRSSQIWLDNESEWLPAHPEKGASTAFSSNTNIARPVSKDGAATDLGLTRDRHKVEMRSAPQLLAGEARAFDQCLELGPHDGRMNAAMERALREAAVGPGDHVLAPQQTREPYDPLGDELRMLHHIGGVADDAWDEQPALGHLDVLPHYPFMLMARIRALDHVGADLHAQDQVYDVLERDVADVRARPAAPAHMISNALRRQSLDRVVEHLHVQRHPLAILLEARRRHHAVIGGGGARIIELKDEAGIDDHLVFGAHRRADRADELLLALVVFILAVRDHARRRRHRHERLGDIHALERSLEVVDVALQLLLPGIGDRSDAYRVHVCGNALASIELGVELGKARAVSAALEHIAARLKGAALEARQAIEHILRPADRLAELAIAHDVEAGVGLRLHHVGNRLGE